jgi:hypothetical protein
VCGCFGSDQLLTQFSWNVVAFMSGSGHEVDALEEGAHRRRHGLASGDAAVDEPGEDV